MRSIANHALLMLLAVAPICAAQTSKMVPTDKGFSSYTSFEQTHDSASNWSSVLDSSITYNFNKRVGVSVGVPVQLMQNQVSTSTTTTTGSAGTTPLTASYNSLGDMRMGLTFSSPTPVLHYVGTFTATAPTGDTSVGLSTGRPTVDFNNRLEYDLGRFTPLAEIGIGDSNTLINSLIKRPYSTLGALPHFKGGLSFEVVKNLSIEIAGYENVPIGNQKLYSKLYKSSGASGSGSASDPAYKKGSFTSGTGISEDNGFSTSVSTKLGKRMDVTVIYDHSVHQQLDTVAFSLGFRMGKANSN